MKKELTKEDVSEILKNQSFKFAKSMPKIPHEYSHRENWLSDKEFVDVVLFIRQNGKAEKFWKKEFIYLTIGEYKYWTMGNPVCYTNKKKTFILNRAKI